MKKLLPVLLLLLFCRVQAQITSPIIKANFGVDADLRANYFNGFAQNGNDDWFTNSPGTGEFVIDTTGAAAIRDRYATDPAFRRLPFYRTMRFAPYSVVNNRLLLDGVFIRDYHGDDSTSFSSGNKNGQSPADWQTPVSTVVQNKTDIEDMLVHIRRAGPNATDSLWLFGGVSIIGTNGERYFDFEMYQTDIFYQRSTLKFYNYGPDAGHTSWLFDASGKIIRPGDVIFTAEFKNARLSLLEARIWVHKSALNMTPAAFNWGGAFDGASTGSDYGYANIKPKTAGSFYTGLASGNNTWAGPFQMIDDADKVQSTYGSDQFMEFSVNLTKLGLDPMTMLGGSACGLPFRRILVKSRSSNSFTATLKDFVGPFDFFMAPRVEAAADVPLFCGTAGTSRLMVVNPVSTSLYKWSTPNGRILGDSTGTTVYADKDGMYVVTQQLMDGCGDYATDTVYITHDSTCAVLNRKDINLAGLLRGGKPLLRWTCSVNDRVGSYELQRSLDGQVFETIQRFAGTPAQRAQASFEHTDGTLPPAPHLYYRVKITGSGPDVYSNTVRLSPPLQEQYTVYPNPASRFIRLSLAAGQRGEVRVQIVSASGKPVFEKTYPVKAGYNTFEGPEVSQWPAGVYLVCFEGRGLKTWKKLVVQPQGSH